MWPCSRRPGAELSGLIFCVGIIISIIVIIITFIALRQGRGHVTRLPSAVAFGVIVATAPDTNYIFVPVAEWRGRKQSNSNDCSAGGFVLSVSPHERQTSAYTN